MRKSHNLILPTSKIWSEHQGVDFTPLRRNMLITLKYEWTCTQDCWREKDGCLATSSERCSHGTKKMPSVQYCVYPPTTTTGIKRTSFLRVTVWMHTVPFLKSVGAVVTIVTVDYDVLHNHAWAFKPPGWTTPHWFHNEHVSFGHVWVWKKISLL